MFINNIKNLKFKTGFTLIELLIVIVIVSVIFFVVLVALDPATRFANARNSTRWQEARSVLDAIKFYQIDNDGSLPTGVDSLFRVLGTDATGCDILCGGGGSQILTHDFDSSADFNVSNGSLIEVDAGDNNLVRLIDLGGSTYSISKPYVELTTPEILNNPSSLDTITDIFGGGNVGSVEYSVKHNSSDKWFNGSSWIINSGELQIGEGTWDANLVAIWHLNESSGVIVDSKGSNNGIYNGVLYSQSGKLNTALGFDSSNDLVMGPSSNQITGDNLQTITLSVWVKHTYSGDNGYILSLKRSSSASTLISLDAGNTGAGNLGLLTRNYANTTHSWLNYNGGYNDGNWHHLVGVVNGLSRILYIDGVQRNSDNAGMQSVAGNTSEVSIGGFHTSNPISFNGIIDEVAIYTRALNANEVRQLYADQNNNKHSNTESELDSSLSSLAVSNNDTITLVSYLISDGSQAVELSNLNLSWIQSGGTTPEACLDISSDLADYLNFIPIDPQTGTFGKTNYAIKQVGTSSVVNVVSCGAELGEVISVQR